MSAYSDLVLAHPNIRNFWKLADTTADLKNGVALTMGTAVAQRQLGRVVDDLASQYVRASASQSHADASPATLTGAHSVELLFKIPAGTIVNGWQLFGTRGSSGQYSTELLVDPANSASLRFGLGNGSAWYNPAGPVVGDPTFALTGQPTEFYKVVVTGAGTCQFIQTVGAYDSYGALYNNAGTLVASDDDSAGGGRWAFTPTLAVGTYWLMMSSLSSGRGAYTLRANPGTATLQSSPSGPYAVPFSAPHTALPLSPSTDHSGSIDTLATSLATYGSSLARDSWHHVVLAVGADGSWELFLDGASLASGTWGLAGTPLLFDGTHNLTIGNYGRGYDSAWAYDGWISDFAVYDAKLNLSTALAHNNALGPVAQSSYFTAAMPAQVYLARTLAALPAVATGGGGPVRPTVGQIWPRPS